jgi:hypothetical protein
MRTQLPFAAVRRARSKSTKSQGVLHSETGLGFSIAASSRVSRACCNDLARHDERRERTVSDSEAAPKAVTETHGEAETKAVA